MRQRVFGIEDQLAFAEISGDRNPMHMDAIAARRMLFGSPVVHGIHILLWCLDCCLEGVRGPVELTDLKAIFSKPVKIDEEVSLIVAKSSGSTWDARMKLERDGVPLTSIKAGFASSRHRTSDACKDRFPEMIPPRNLSENEVAADSGNLELCLNVRAVSKLFPNLIRSFSHLQTALILNTSRLVGVMCPGMHSIFSEIELFRAKSGQNAVLHYEVAKFDRRFSLAHINIFAPEMIGSIKAFRRRACQQQPDYSSLKTAVKEGEFHKQRALIIGGSRGLGEVVAKLLSAGGAEVIITYHRGREDARCIVDDAMTHGVTIYSLPFDVLSPSLEAFRDAIAAWPPTDLYYFATPAIFSGNKGVFSARLFDTFCGYYVYGFVNAVNLFADCGLRRIFYPSTVAIDEIPADMGEYAAAKQAGEALCRFLEKTRHGLYIYRPRLPRMATDQTVSMMPVKNLDPATVMIEELRVFRNMKAGD